MLFEDIRNCITIPIIFLTANSSKEIMQKVKALHAYGFVQKGGDNYALLSTIEMAFNLFEAIVKTKNSILDSRNHMRNLKAVANSI